MLRITCTIVRALTQGHTPGKWPLAARGLGEVSTGWIWKTGGPGGEATALQFAPSPGKSLDRCAAGAHLLWECWTAPARRVGRGVCCRRRAPSQAAAPTPVSGRAVAGWVSAARELTCPPRVTVARRIPGLPRLYQGECHA